VPVIPARRKHQQEVGPDGYETPSEKYLQHKGEAWLKWESASQANARPRVQTLVLHQKKKKKSKDAQLPLHASHSSDGGALKSAARYSVGVNCLLSVSCLPPLKQMGPRSRVQ
jgi:hypothetical protein